MLDRGDAARNRAAARMHARVGILGTSTNARVRGWHVPAAADMPSYTRIDGEWRVLCTERGAAQGRPLSPALSAVLLQPCIEAAEAAMVERMGVTRAQFRESRETCGIAAYLDDCTIVAPPDVAAVGLDTFRTAVVERGWRVNVSKTVCGVGYYTDDAPFLKWYRVAIKLMNASFTLYSDYARLAPRPTADWRHGPTTIGATAHRNWRHGGGGGGGGWWGWGW
eukprot:COSAG02_NODE_2605_length_8442_cov_9.552080_14_plen_222_part_01